MNATTRVLIGLALGALGGLALDAYDSATAVKVADWIQPLGRLWLNALQMTVVPLVFALVVVGVNAASDAAASGRIARRALGVFVVLLTIGVTLAALTAPMLYGLFTRHPSLAEALGGAVAQNMPHAGQAVGWADWLNGIVPSNALMAAAQSAMLPLVVFALFFGFALSRIDAARRELMVSFFQAIADAMIVSVHWVLWAAPLGVFALILAVCARAGIHMIGALGVYVLVESTLYVMATLAMLLVAWTWGRERVRRYMPALVPAQIVAASTQSSLAALPAMLECSVRRLGYPQRVAALVLPMAVSLCRLTSPVQYIASSCFIAWALNIDLGPAQLAAGAALAIVISLGAVSLPGQVSFMATNMPVAQAMGVPVGPLALMLAMDALPDAIGTLGNVTADITAVCVVSRQSSSDAA
ncbi:MAG: dicarboxylate/amino acid:cation symporter [Rudaea sp.]|uniref:dicarboxylate/amino acid:cation symporter n=1 Tax=Rudaea sp. TaxID=2136325 RepID=UPI0039E58663